MKDPRNLLIVALAAAAAFLAGGALNRGEALGQGYPGGTADSNNRMIAVTGTIGSGVSVLYVIDTVERQLAIYQCRGGKSVELVAARRIEWDLKVDQFHDESLYTPDSLRKRYYGGAETEEGDGGGSDKGSGDSGGSGGPGTKEGE
jgi:hypothetical protein